MKNCILLFLFLMLTACGFHPRSKADFSPKLYHVYFSGVHAYSPMFTQIQSMLTSMDIDLVKNQREATYTIHISVDDFSSNRADVTNATLPSTMNFTKTTAIDIVDNCTKKIVITKTFSTTQSISLNTNQVYTGSSNGLAQQELDREQVLLIYYWLVSTDIKKALSDDSHKTAKHCLS